MLNGKAPLGFIATIALLGATGCGVERPAAMTPDTSQSAAGSSLGKAGCQPDFTLALNPASATITAGQTVKVTVDLASICGLSGTIFVGIHSISPPPQGGNGFTIRQPRYDIPLDANGTAVAYIWLGATQAPLRTMYTITIQGKDITGGCCYGLTHSATFMLTVT